MAGKQVKTGNFGVKKPQNATKKPQNTVKKPRKSRAVAKYVPTADDRNLVQSAVAMGRGHRFIAFSMGIGKTTLYKHYRKELDGGKEQALMKTGGVAYEAAMRAGKDSRFQRALEYFENTRCGIVTKTTLNQVSDDGSMSPSGPAVLLPTGPVLDEPAKPADKPAEKPADKPAAKKVAKKPAKKVAKK